MSARRQMDLTRRAGAFRVACLPLDPACSGRGNTPPAGLGRGLFPNDLRARCGFHRLVTSGRGGVPQVSPASHSAGGSPCRVTRTIYRGGGSDPQKAARSSLLDLRAAALCPARVFSGVV